MSAIETRSVPAGAVDMAELAAANVRLESFASSLCHDLLQPVAALDGFLSLLESVDTKLDADHRAWLAGAVRAKNRVAHVVDAHYRNATQNDVPLLPVDLDEIVRQLVPDLIEEIGSADLLVGELPVVAADPGFVTQVLANLFQNAGRYRHEQRPLTIEIRARRDESSWVVTVSDRGRGICANELEWIFEPGRRGRSAAGTAGTGTGLATVKTLMRRMSGDIWAEPRAIGGVQMCLRFRAVPDRNTPR
jgi:signal transduction histidine kinase